MSTTEFYILLQHSFGSLMHLIQAPVQFDQLLEVKNTFHRYNKKLRRSDKKQNKYSGALFLMSRIVCIWQQAELMIIQHQWTHMVQKQWRQCSQLLIKYLEAQLVPLTFSIPTDTKRWAKSLLTPKKANIKRLLFELNFISMQGGYTELMFKQILNSQEEDDQTDRNTQVKNYTSSYNHVQNTVPACANYNRAFDVNLA